MQDNIFYVYIYRNPLKGNEPFYVGKGKGRRAYSHLLDAKNPDTPQSHKINTIRKILASGLSPEIMFVDENLSESDAFELEVFLIKEVGRRDCGTGTLTNQTDGGEGSSGFLHTEESRRKISEALLGKEKSESARASLKLWHQLNPDKNPSKHPDYAEKVSGENHWNYGKPAVNKGVPMSEEQKKLLSENTSGDKHHFFGKPCSDSRREAIRAATKGVKKSTTVNMLQEKVECPHCGKIGGCRAMKQWHFDNCKDRKDAD